MVKLLQFIFLIANCIFKHFFFNCSILPLFKCDLHAAMRLSLRAGSKTIFVVANLWGFERPWPIHGSYSGGVCPQVCYNVINIMIYGRRMVYGIISCKL